MKYYKEYGSNRGCVLLHGKWVSVKCLNYIALVGWDRWQGPPTDKMNAVMNTSPQDARVLFPCLTLLKPKE